MHLPLPLALAPPHHATNGRRELHAQSPRDACCSRNPPLPHRSRHTTRSLAPRAAPPSLAPAPLAAAAVAIVEPRDAPTAAPSPPLPRTSPHHAHPILALTLASRRPRARRSKTTWAKGIAAASCVLGLKLRPL